VQVAPNEDLVTMAKKMPLSLNRNTKRKASPAQVDKYRIEAMP
jgi:hypothetical protein